MNKPDPLYLGTNTKMFKTLSETEAFLNELRHLTRDLAGSPLRLFVIPSYTALERAGHITAHSHIQLGAQNMGWEDRGPFTGEISPLMLKETGVDIVEIGHSERRHILGENDFDEEKKVKKAAEYGFTPLLCIGETMTQREYGITDEVLGTQLKIGLHSLSRELAGKLWIAYEPVWAIGTNGTPPESSYVAKRHAYIRKTLNQLYGNETGSHIPILYGGSVNVENAKELITLPSVNGLFIGRSAWEAGSFNQIIRRVLPYAERGHRNHSQQTRSQ